jgi:hypothetical protein
MLVHINLCNRECVGVGVMVFQRTCEEMFISLFAAVVP